MAAGEGSRGRDRAFDPNGCGRRRVPKRLRAGACGRGRILNGHGRGRVPKWLRAGDRS